MILALAIAPQRTMLWGNLARFLAAPELLASPLADRVRTAEIAQLGGRDWLIVDLEGEVNDDDLAVIWRLGTITGVFESFLRIGEIDGPLLRPLSPHFQPFLSPEMPEARRYRGKTSELFTSVLLNLALFASDFARHLTSRLRILDPLAGGGTTLFTALVRGYDAAGIEHARSDFDTTSAYVQQFLQETRTSFQRREERLRGVGRRVQFTIGRKTNQRLLTLIHGDTHDTPALLSGLPGGARFHAIVADLPYGIQHSGEVVQFFERAVPRWASVLLPGGVIALAWESRAPTREAAIALVERHRGLSVVDTPPYNALAHQVDRQIRQRDVLVLRKDSSADEEVRGCR